MVSEEDLHYFDKYVSGSHLFPFGIIVGSRGCPYRCSFCCSHGVRRIHSANYVFAQIVELNNRYGIRNFVFFDPLFTTSSRAEQKRTEQLSKMILCWGLQIQYVVDMRADVILKLPQQLLELMIRSGCTEFNLGLEKGSNRLLKKMTKDMTIEQHFEAVAKLRKAAEKLKREVWINGTFILGGPEETKDDIRDTVFHSLALNLDEATVYPLEIHPGTRIYKEALEEKIIKPGLEPYIDPKEYPFYVTKDLPRRYLNEIEESYEKMFKSLRQFRGTMQWIEEQFLPENERCLVSYPIKKTKKLDHVFKEFLQISIDCLKNHPRDELLKDQMKKEPIVAYELKVEKTIHSIERSLKRKYPNYDEDYCFGDYQFGWLLNEWKFFLSQFENFFSSEKLQ